MSPKLLLISYVTLFSVLALSCKAIPAAQTPYSTSEQETQKAARDTWEIKWDQIVQGAKKEGKVVVYGAATGAIRDALVKAFSNKFGIPVEYMAAKGPEIAAKILAERRASLYIPDVIIGASVPSIATLKPAGVFDPVAPVLILPENTNPEVWWEKKIPWVDNEQKYFIAFLAYASNNILINKGIVQPEEINSYRNLLAPKWKGKMAMHDPTAAGSGRSFLAVLGWYIMGVDYLRQLANQEPFIARDHRLLAEWVARGKYPVGLAIESEAIEQMRTAGVANLEHVITGEGTYVTTGTGFLSLPKNAPHPNASTLFINWLLSKEGQTVYTDVARLQSARVDIPTTNIDPLSMRKPGIKYYHTSTEEYQLRGPESIELAKEIFGHLIK